MSRVILSCLSPFFLILFSCGFAKDFSLLNGLRLPDEAFEVKKIKIRSSENHQQLSFKLMVEYPSTKYSDLIESDLISEGWLKCSSNIDGWSSFVNELEKKPKKIFQRLRYWINLKENRLLIITGRYTSLSLKLNEPEDNKLSSSVYVEQYESYQHLKRDYVQLGISCEGQ